MTPTLLQTQFLKRYIALGELPVPENGPFSDLSIDAAWLKIAKETETEILVAITDAGRRAFWSGVREFGRRAVMGKVAIATDPKGIV